MKQSTRLFINVFSSFTRMSFTVGVGLLVTRLLLQYLGKTDFGLILALGATGSLLQFITGALTVSMQRQLGFEIARNDLTGVSRVFSTGWVLFLALGGSMWLFGVALTPLILRVLTIPPDRAVECWWVYQISLLSLVLTVTATPYQAMIVAHQQLTVNAIADSAVAVTRLAAVLLLLVVPWDRMVAFAALQLAGLAIVRWAVNAYCLWRYDGSWPRLRNFDRTQLKEIAGIATWSLLLQMSWRFRMQGGILLLNVFFGPVVNAAYGITVQVAGYILSFAQSLRLAISPALVQAEAKGVRENVHRLTLISGKYTVLLLSFVFVPIWLEAETILHLWLGDLPPYTVILTRLVIIWALMHVFSFGYQSAIVATGKMGWYTLLTLINSLLILIISGFGFYFGLSPWFLPATTCVGIFALLLISVYGIGAQIGLPPARWFHEKFVPTLLVLTPATLVASAVHIAMTDGPVRVLAVVAAYGAIATPLIWCVGFASWERQRFMNLASSAMARLR